MCFFLNVTFDVVCYKDDFLGFELKIFGDFLVAVRFCFWAGFLVVILADMCSQIAAFGVGEEQFL